MRKFTILLAATGAMLAVAAATPARADWHGDGWRGHEWREHVWRERAWREHEWREHHAPDYRYGYAPPPVVYGYAYPY